MQTLKLLKTFALSTIVVASLAGCESTPKISNPFGNTSYDFDPKWKDSVVMIDNACTNFDFSNVLELIKTFYVANEAESYATGSDDTQVLQNYLLSATLINKANICLANALEISNALILLEKERNILLGGTSIDEDALVDHRAYSTEASEAIRTRIEQVKALKPQQKGNIAIGISTYIGGTYTAAETSKDLTKLVKTTLNRTSESQGLIKQGWGAIENLGREAMEVVGSATIIAFVSKGMPSVLENWLLTGKTLMEFAQANDIDVPDDATALYNLSLIHI